MSISPRLTSRSILNPTLPGVTNSSARTYLPTPVAQVMNSNRFTVFFVAGLVGSMIAMLVLASIAQNNIRNGAAVSAQTKSILTAQRILSLVDLYFQVIVAGITTQVWANVEGAPQFWPWALLILGTITPISAFIVSQLAEGDTPNNGDIRQQQLVLGTIVAQVIIVLVTFQVYTGEYLAAFNKINRVFFGAN